MSRIIKGNLHIAICATMMFCGAVYAQGESPTTSLINDYLTENEQKICDKYASIPRDSCLALVEAAAKSVAGEQVDKAALKSRISEDFNNPQYLNSVLSKIFDDHVPIGLEFKSLDSKANGGSVLGLSYDFSYNLHKSKLIDASAWLRQSRFYLQATGTLANDRRLNPRNFLETKISGSRTYTTNIPQQSDEFADKLINASLSAAMHCDGPGAGETEACKQAKNLPYAMLDSTSNFLSAFQRYEVGLNAGYETDQSFDAQQSVLGIFAFAQYEDWAGSSLLGGLNITPSLRVAVNKVDPNDQTPRAQAGEADEYYRLSGELSLWVPVGNYFDQAIVLTVNYRRYQEFNPSDIVKDSNLDTYNLRTFSLTSPTGLFVSYSSGKLPFDLQSDDVVALGWKTYF